MILYSLSARPLISVCVFIFSPYVGLAISLLPEAKCFVAADVGNVQKLIGVWNARQTFNSHLSLWYSLQLNDQCRKMWNFCRYPTKKSIKEVNPCQWHRLTLVTIEIVVYRNSGYVCA